MDASSTKHELEKIKEYTAKGYTSNYKAVDGKLKDIENDTLLLAKDVRIMEEARYEGMSNPADLSIFYAIEVPGKSKGTLLVPYGPTADTELAEVMRDVSLNEHNRNK